ncbi:MAG: DUF1080 domain-containing protein [Planctomycetota bacterium]
MRTNLVSAVVLVLSSVTAVGAKDAEAGTCPISGKPGNPKIALFHEGKSVTLCCKNCLGKFRASHENSLSTDEKKVGWSLLFDGKSLKGFQKPTRDGKWSVKDGSIHATGGRGVLATESKHDHFHLRFDARIQDTGEKRGNSGVFIRSTGLKAFRGRWPDGYEVQMDHGDPKFWTGSLFKVTPSKKTGTKDGQWFQVEIEAFGPRIRVKVNGKLVTDYKDPKPAVKGPISFQVHHPTDVVELKNIKVRAMSQTKKVDLKK